MYIRAKHYIKFNVIRLVQTYRPKPRQGNKAGSEKAESMQEIRDRGELVRLVFMASTKPKQAKKLPRGIYAPAESSPRGLYINDKLLH